MADISGRTRLQAGLEPEIQRLGHCAVTLPTTVERNNGVARMRKTLEQVEPCSVGTPIVTDTRITCNGTSPLQ